MAIHKQALVWFGRMLMLVSLGYLGVQMWTHAGTVQALSLGIDALSLLLLLTLLPALAVIAYASMWHVIISSRFNLSLRRSLYIYGRSQIAKYLPGNVFHYVGRAALCKQFGVSLKDCGISISIETAIMLVVATLVGGTSAIIGGYSIGLPRLEASPMTLLALAVAVFAGYFLLRFRSALESYFAGWSAAFTIGRIGRCVLLNVMAYLLFGLTLYLTLSLLWPAVAAPTPLDFAGGFALAWVAGFVIPGAPGGLGIREIVLFTIYGPVLGASVAAELFVVVRILTTGADLLVYGLTYALEPTELARTGAG